MNIIKQGNLYKIESSSKKGLFYTVNSTKKTCTCPAFLFRYQKEGLVCKHVEAVLESLGESEIEETDAVITFVRKNGPVPIIDVIEKFSESCVNALIKKGELIEEKRNLKILD